jgi:lipopolysaccharide transport system ATP-binding protein
VGTGFHPELTGRENIFLNGAILGMGRAEIKKNFDAIVDFAEVEKFLDTPVKHYSSGMYVRLAFAVAAHLEPEILIVDEVLAVGDAAFQKKCLGKMEDVGKEGRTVLFVSHNMLAIKRLCNRSIWMEAGEVRDDHSTLSVVQSYSNNSISNNGSQKRWNKEDRPRNHSIAINSIKLKNSQKEEVVHINISEEAYIEIEYEVIKPNSKVSFSIDLFNSEFQCIFSSLSNLENFLYGKFLRCGTYQTYCSLYGNLLNNGNFSISVNGFSSNWTDNISVSHALFFKAIDDGILKNDYLGDYGGDIRPKLTWVTNYISD